VHANVAKLGRHAGFVAIQTRGIVVWRGMNCTDVVRHLVTVRAMGSVVCRIVCGGTRSASDGQERQGAGGDRGNENESPHDRKPVPFQLRTSASEAK
jgi:hypothetical protein